MCLVNSNNDTVKKRQTGPRMKKKTRQHARQKMESDRNLSDIILRDTGKVVVSNAMEIEAVVDIKVESRIAEVVITTRFHRLIRTEDGVMFE